MNSISNLMSAFSYRIESVREKYFLLYRLILYFVAFFKEEIWNFELKIFKT